MDTKPSLTPAAHPARDRLSLISASLTKRPVSRLLQGKRALVTGGSRGIGAAIVRRFAREGANVALTYSSNVESAHLSVAAAREHGARALAIQADNAQVDTLRAAIDQTVAELGGIDILVHSAGVGVFGHIRDCSIEDLDRALAVNLRGTYIATQAAIRHMGVGGRVIMIGSGSSERSPFAGNSVYAMTKSGLIGLVRALSRDLAPDGITVNNIQPGPIDTDMNPADSEFAEMVCNQVIAVRRYGTADEVAAMVAYVAGPETDFLTGATLTMDGGFSA